MTTMCTPTGDPSRRAVRRRRPLAAALGAATLLVLSACTPPVDPGPTTGAALAADVPTVGVVAGAPLTVRGSGYNPNANIGTRPPLWNLPSGVYVVFACVTGEWRPSAGAGAGSRQVIQQFWAVPGQAQFDTIGGAAAGAALMDGSGAFAVTFTPSPNGCSGRYAVITYPGSGAVPNPGEEVELPVTFAAT